ncbi:carbohydrate-binding family 9-like protein [Fodinibius sp. Rm-B-1B1-1]|uniref:carbohydrate-binding family 9-like protein n=1 Tax=Fodinibius alkaliphilus TaxID=3140241 RepID=UPI00315A100C
MDKVKSTISFIAVFVFSVSHFFGIANAQHRSPSIEFNPQNYVSVKITDSLKIDGRLEEHSWKKVNWTDSFLDIEGETAEQPRYDTKVKMLWDDQYFYIAANIEEPNLWATLDERDAIIFHENNFEVFIDPDGDTHNYYEFEVNALGTYWDLMLTKPYRDGGKAIDAWDIRDIKVGIDLKGTLNHPSDRDSGWTVELAIPWKALEEAAPEGRKPKSGEFWRVNFSRVEWKIAPQNGEYVKQSDTEDNWTWSPQGLINMHYPEMWGYVLFAEGKDNSQLQIDDALGLKIKEQIKWYLRQLYYQQQEYWDKNGSYTSDFSELNQRELQNDMSSQVDFEQWSEPEIHATDHTFEISIERLKTKNKWYIRENGRVWQEEN